MTSTPFSFTHNQKLTSGRMFTPSDLAQYVAQHGQEAIRGHELAFTEDNEPCALIVESITIAPTKARQTPTIKVTGTNGTNQATEHTITAPNQIYLFDTEQVTL